MKKVLSILLTTVLLLSLVGCGSNASSDKQPTAKNKTLTAFTEALQKGNKDKANKYGDYDKVVEQLDISGLSMTDEEKTELVKAVFSSLKLAIHTVEDKDDNTKIVTATITTKDMTSALDTAIRSMYTYASQNFTQAKTPGKLQSKNYELFLQAINNKDLKTVEKQATFTIKKTDGQWKVDLDNASLDALYGGYVNKKVDTITSAYDEFVQSQTNAINGSADQAAADANNAQNAQ